MHLNYLIHFQLKKFSNYFKDKGFKTIYYRDSAVNFPQTGFYVDILNL